MTVRISESPICWIARLIVVSVFFVQSVGAALADSWPQFRGPTGQGRATATNLPLRWSPKTNIAWRQEIPGQGWSSPVIHDGRIYLTTATRGQRSALSLRVVCLDEKTGRVLGDVEAFTSNEPTIHRKNSHASPTPIIDDGKLYVHFGHHAIACLDLEGKILWKNKEIRYNPVHGCGGSPVLVNDRLVFSVDGAEQTFIAAINCKSGMPLWKTPRKADAARKFSFATPLLIEVNGRPQVICPGSNSVLSVDPKSGEEIWRVRYDGYSVVPRPVFGQGLVFICTGYGSPDLLAIRPDGRGDVTGTHVAWRETKAVSHTPSLLLVGEELYMISDKGIGSCRDAKTGKLHWQKRIGGAFSASPLYADGRIYLQNETGVGYVLQPGKEYQELATNALRERTLASYAVSNQSIFIRSEKHLFCVREQQE